MKTQRMLKNLNPKLIMIKSILIKNDINFYINTQLYWHNLTFIILFFTNCFYI